MHLNSGIRRYLEENKKGKLNFGSNVEETSRKLEKLFH